MGDKPMETGKIHSILRDLFGTNRVAEQVH